MTSLITLNRANIAQTFGEFISARVEGLHIADVTHRTCCEWGRARGVNIVKLAVIATNKSAIRCYERVASRLWNRTKCLVVRRSVL